MLYKKILSNKFDLLWTTTFSLYYSTPEKVGLAEKNSKRDKQFSLFFSNYQVKKGATTLSITTFIITTFNITTFSITTLRITTLSIMTLSITIKESRNSAQRHSA